MSNFDHEKDQSGYQQALQASDWRRFLALFDGDRNYQNFFLQELPDAMASLTSLGVDYETAADFAYYVAKEHQIHKSADIYRFSKNAFVLRNLKRETSVCNETMLQLIVDTVALDSEGDLWHNETFNRKINRALVSLSESQNIEYAGQLLKTFHDAGKAIGLHPYSSMVTTEINGRKTATMTEFYRNKEGMALVRVGHLFFIDEKIAKVIPSEIQRSNANNLIIIPNLQKTEFGNRLGYFTANTLASLMSIQNRDQIILDCGTGCGALALAARRLGFPVVLGVDIDASLLKQAGKMRSLNGYNEQTVSLLKADLRKKELVAGRLRTLGNRKVGIISNIGHWNDYPISNLTTVGYIPFLKEQGIEVDFYIGGGYSNKETRKYKKEATMLTEYGFGKLPDIDHQADSFVLAKFGFQRVSSSLSEELIRPSSFSHNGGSVVSRVI